MSTREMAAPGTFAWFDLATEDFAVSRDFYSGLFGWSVGQQDNSGYSIISSNGTALGGIADVGTGPDDRSGGQWVPVLNVPSVEAALQTTKSAGGTVVLNQTSTSDGDFATIRDNRGALVTLYEGTTGFPLERVGEENHWIWADLFTDKARASSEFYKSLVGFDTRQDGDLTVFVRNGGERGGLVVTPKSNFPPTWLPYVSVSDIDATVQRSLSLGGGPLTVEDDAAIILDPRGGAIGIALGGS